MQDNPHVGHRRRLRNEFLHNGAGAFSEVRALELLLFYALARRDTNPLAHALLDRFGSLSGVFSATIPELCSVDGIAENTAVLIRLIPELMQLADKGKNMQSRKSFENSAVAGEMVKSFFIGESNEKFILFCLDSKNRLKHTEEISRGVVNSVNVDIRRAAEIALNYKSAACIAAHNHPDGDSTPSLEDRQVTERLKQALSALGIPLHDHIIIGSDGYYSFADAGLL